MVWVLLAILLIAIFLLIPEWRLPVGLVFLAFVGVFVWVFLSQRAEEQRREAAAIEAAVAWVPAEGTEVALDVDSLDGPRFFSAFSSVEFAGTLRNASPSPVSGVRVALTVLRCPQAQAPAADCAVLGSVTETFDVALAPGTTAALARTVRFDGLPRATGGERVDVALVLVRRG